MPKGSAVLAVVVSLLACFAAACGGGDDDDVVGDGDADVDADGDGDGDGDGDSDICESDCTVAGDTRCGGDIIETCSEVDAGCTRWVAGEDCLIDGVCRDGDGGAVCMVCNRGFEGDYVISDTASLEELRGYAAVSGSLTISARDVASLDGLECLQDVAGDLSLEGCLELTNLDGLRRLNSVGGSLVIGRGRQGNPALSDLHGLTHLSNVGLDLRIENNSLTNVDGLNSLSVVPGELIIWANENLANLDGLGSLTSVGALRIGNDATLTSLTGLGALASVASALEIRDNDALTSLHGLESLVAVGGGVGIGCSPGGDMPCGGNFALADLNGLTGLTSVGGGLFVAGNDALSNLDGLRRLTSIGGNLGIGCSFPAEAWDCPGNGLLGNLDGLVGLTSVGDRMGIGGNVSLPTCEADALEARLRDAGWAGEATIEGNDDAGMCE